MGVQQLSKEVLVSRLRGAIPAIVTPFKQGAQEIDFPAYSALLGRLLTAGSTGIVVGGSTGESPTLAENELEQLIGLTVAARQDQLVIGCINSSSTQQGVHLARAIKGWGADTVLVTAPPYNKPPQEGLYRYFSEVAEGFGGPIIAYNIPGRTGVKIEARTIARLVESGAVCAVKDSTGVLTETLAVRQLCGDRVSILSGEDALTVPILASGGQGVISATANLVPRSFVAMLKAWESGDIKGALSWQIKLLPIIEAMFIETNPIPVKFALFARGLIPTPAVRGPLVEPAAASQQLLRQLELPEIESN